MTPVAVIATTTTAAVAIAATRTTAARGDDDDDDDGVGGGDGGSTQVPYGILECQIVAPLPTVGRVRRPAKARSSRVELPNARCTFHFPSPLPVCMA